MAVSSRRSLATKSISQWLADTDLKARPHGGRASGVALLSLAWASIGVIYGDIGTSPLYVYSTIFDAEPSQEDVLCATSLIFWSITMIVMVKYVLIVLWADDNGEGGTFALYATICRACGIPAVNSVAMPADKQLYEAASTTHSLANTPQSSMRQLKLLPLPQHGPEAAGAASHEQAQHDSHMPHGKVLDHEPPAQPQPQLTVIGSFLRDKLSHSAIAQKALLVLTLLMTAMVLGDGVLTPSISVLSAVSGLQVKAGLSNSAVVGITCAILVVLFSIQSWGTQRVGVLFAPTVALWFLSNVLVGIYSIAVFEGGAIFRALSPHYIGIWFQKHGTDGWMDMAGVFLCLTGCEAMFADLGHFSRQSVQLSFAVAVYPSLILTYFGQASWLMHNLDGYATVFYSSLPIPVFWPVFVVSVLASIVASQALITGAFSMVYQSMAMGCFPRFRVHHTSEEVGGQIFIPEVNYTLLVLCVAVVAGFQSGTAIGNAYGIAVNLVMLLTVFLVSLVMLVAWGTHPLLVLLFLAPFALFEGVFLSANILNIPHGGWFSITLAVVLTAINILWIWGTAQKAAALKREQFQLSDLLTTKPPSTWHQAGGSCGMSSQGWRLFRVSNGAPVHRNPGMALVYSESPFNVPAVFKRLVESWGVHSIVVFLTVRQVPIPHVGPHERLLLAPLEFRGFYKCVARYGYKDKVDQGELFVQSILDKIAQQVPGHAAADGVLPHRGVDSLSHTGPCSTSAGDGCSARTVPHLPPSIPEDPEPAARSHGNSVCNNSKCSSSSGSSVMEITVQCHSDADHTTARPATLGSAGADSAPAGPIVSQDGSVQGLLSPSQHASTMDLMIPTAAEPVMGLGPVPHRRTTWEARRTADGPAAVSPLAAHAVYVLHRSIIQVRPSGSRWGQRSRKFLMEVVYQQLWQLTTRFWEGWRVPPVRMFEVGMVVEI